MAMKNNLTYILLVLISLFISALAGERVSSSASDEATKFVHIDSKDVDMLLYGDLWGDSRIIEDHEPEEQVQIADEGTLGDTRVNDLQQASANSYESSSAGSDWVDALMVESSTEDMILPGLNEAVVSDYKSLLSQMANLSPEKVSRAKVAKALHTVAVKGSDPEDCRVALTFVDRTIRYNIGSSADALKSSSLTSNDLLKQSQFLNRIRLKADLSIIPALLLALM